MHDKITMNFADEAAVRDLYRQLMDGWNRGSGEDFAAVFAENGDLVAFDGTHFKGREEIAPFHQELFDKWLKGTRLVGKVKDVRFLSPDACSGLDSDARQIRALAGARLDPDARGRA